MALALENYPDWPAAMHIDWAVAYTGLKEATFKRYVKEGIMPQPAEPEDHVKVWLRVDLDKSLAAMRGDVSGNGIKW